MISEMKGIAHREDGSGCRSRTETSRSPEVGKSFDQWEEERSQREANSQSIGGKGNRRSRTEVI